LFAHPGKKKKILGSIKKERRFLGKKLPGTEVSKFKRGKRRNPGKKESFKGKTGGRRDVNTKQKVVRGGGLGGKNCKPLPHPRKLGAPAKGEKTRTV